MRLVTLARQWRRVLDAQLAPLGLSGAGWPPLAHLAHAGGGLTQRELAERIGIDGSSLVRLLDQHTGAGWIERREDPQDRRAWRLYLTREGRAMARRIQAVIERVESDMLAGVDAAQLQAMRTGFDHIGRAIAALEVQP